MEEKELEFSLEDILREFGSGSSPEDEQSPAGQVPEEPDISAEPEELETPAGPQEQETSAVAEEEDDDEDFTSPFWQSIRNAPLEPEPESEPEPAPEEEEDDVRVYERSTTEQAAAAGDLTETRRFAPVAEHSPVIGGDTVRLDPGQLAEAAKKTAMASGDTVVFAPVGDDTEAALEEPAVIPVPEGAEPFSENWEPRYDEPMGEYIPPEPIVFRPRSRLSELKKKLVAGPERRYYALAEEGVGKYQVLIFLNMLVVALASVAVVLHQMELVQPERMRLLVFGELFAVLVSALLGSDRLMSGFINIFKGKFNLDSLLTVTFAVCVVDCMFCLQEVRVPFCAAFCLTMTFSLWAEFERRNTEMGQMDTMRKAIRLNRVAKAPDCFEGRPGFYVSDGQVEDFMDRYQEISRPEKLMNLYSLTALLAAACIGVAAGLRGGVSAGFQVGSIALMAAAPATAFICQTRPMSVLERRMHKLGVVLCGWSGVKAACGAGVVPLTDNDLFPGGSVKVNGVKFYSQRDPDDTVAYATALIEASGMGIANLFTQLLDSRYGRHYDAQNFRYYENGGIGGEVCGESVLVGSLSFLQEMGVELPEGARVSQAVYCAIDGELCGVFAMAFGKLKGVSAALGTLSGYRGLTPVLATGNFLLSESFIRAKFNANTRRFAFPSMAEREKILTWNPSAEDSSVCALTTQDGLAPVAFAITGARALRSAVNVGTWLHILCGVLGMLIVLLLSIVEGGALLTPANLLVLELIWAVPGLMVTEWTRRL